ncbi:hypothetical protein BR10RB9215_C10995 [Brucella sp. 10RB9215]|nr:hypothetical protein BR10RB9215_C10995 [Brucella sp. 10RB9215]
MEQFAGAVIFAARHQDFGIDQCCRRMDRDFGLLHETGMFMRNDRVGDIFEIGIRAKRYGLGLGCEIRVHFLNAGGRLRGDMGLRVRLQVDFDCVAVALQDAACIGNDADAGKRRHSLIPVKRLLHDQRRTAVQRGKHRALGPVFKAKAQEGVLAERAGG